MGKRESIIKSEIQRLSKREIQSIFIPLRREVRAMRLRLSGLSKNFSALDRVTKEHLQKVPKRRLEASPEEVKASHITPDRIHRLRNRLGISMREMGILTGATIGAVLSWEKGKFMPRGDKKAALVALRKLRKRGARKLLAEKAGSGVKAKGKRAKVETRKKKPGMRVTGRRK